MRRLLYLACLAATLLLTSAVSACSIDGKPSAYANGVRAVIAKGAPTVATYAWWAHFMFPGTFRAGQRIVFHEDDALVRKALQGILPHTPRPSLGSTSQTVFSASWSWMNSPAAPTTSMMIPSTVPSVPEPGLLALATIASIALPPSGPTTFWI